MTHRKKLIEVAMPLEAINLASAREKSIRHGHPSTLHLWWARRPLATCRAMLFGALVDDPSEHPDRFPTDADQARERQRLFDLIEELVLWENSGNKDLLRRANNEIRRSCGDNLPPVYDPFCGGGSIPLEAQRLGLASYATDLNPVSVLITKALIEIPPKFSGRDPIHSDDSVLDGSSAWEGARGLAEDVRYYAKWMCTEAEREIGKLYPKAPLPKDVGGGEAGVVAWLWARTVVCPNPACTATVPLVNGTCLSRTGGRTVSIEFLPRRREDGEIPIRIRSDRHTPGPGTVSRSGAICPACTEAFPLTYVRNQGREGALGLQLLAAVVNGKGRRLFLSPAAIRVPPIPSVPAPPTQQLATNPRAITAPNYGLKRFSDLFTPRQLLLVTTLATLVARARERVLADGADASYADAVATYLLLSIGRLVNRASTQCIWDPSRDNVQQVFARNALPMVWMFAEANPFSDSTGNYMGQVEYLAQALEALPASGEGHVSQMDATSASEPMGALVMTDPPYYDNVPYSDLADFFYVWLRSAGSSLYPDLFATLLTPKAQELIAEPARTGDWASAAAFFEEGLGKVFRRIAGLQNPEYPFCLFYAFKQAERSVADGSIASTGWEAMLQALLDAGFSIDGTWPVRTEATGGLRELGRNALASSIVLVCRPRSHDLLVGTRKEFVAALRAELPPALQLLQQANIAPVDLAQAAIGPGMATFSRFSRVIDAEGRSLNVRAVLSLVNEVLDEIMAEQEGEVDPLTRWAIAWFEQFGFASGSFGVAETLSKAKNTSLGALEECGIAHSAAGSVRLLPVSALREDWDPNSAKRLTAWQATHQLCRSLETGGEAAASMLLRQLGGLGEPSRALAYRLYLVCDRKKWTKEALAYNSLVVAWPDLVRTYKAEAALPVQQEMRTN